ncbi:MAG TPA: hypothetical protein VFI73_13370 [Candidatus Nitrosopolaris sp.]|nr:hypothetical protein [Candidatus Nitrosopolaris sp.]
MPLLIGYSPSFASAKQKGSGASGSSDGGNNTRQTGNNNGGNTGGNTGSTNQQQCSNGMHFDNKQNTCVNDTPNQQAQIGTKSTLNATTPPNCVGETHHDVKTGLCVSNSIPLTDGSCVAGWQISPQNDCTKIPITPATQSKQSNNTGTVANGVKTLIGPILTGPVLPGGDSILKSHILNSPFLLCGPGLHYDQTYGKCLDKNGLITTLDCTGETHANPLTNQCEPDSQHLPSGLDPWHNGGCTQGFHIDNVLDPTGQICFPETTTGTSTPSTPSTPSNQSNNSKTGGGGNGTTTAGNKSSTTTASPHIQSNKTSTNTSTASPHTQTNKTSTNTSTVINQNTVRSQAGARGMAASPSISTGPAYTQTPSMSMWSLSLGKSNFPKQGLRLLANLKPFGTIGVPYTLDISLNLPSTNVSLIAAQITNAGLQHAVIIPINKTAEGTAGESLFQAEIGQTITGINPFTRQPDAISGGGATDLLILNHSNSDIVFNDDSGATMTLRYR